LQPRITFQSHRYKQSPSSLTHHNAEAVLQEVYFSSVALHSSLEQSLTGYFALDNGYSEMDNIDLKPACTNHATHKPVLHGQSLETSGSLLGIVFLH
jgi:hypothetical protein